MTYAIVNAGTAAVGRAGETTEILRRENSCLSKFASPFLLIPPLSKPVSVSFFKSKYIQLRR